ARPFDAWCSPAAWTQALMLAGLACGAFWLLRWQGELPPWQSASAPRLAAAVAAIAAWLGICTAIAWRRIGVARSHATQAVVQSSNEGTVDAGRRMLVVHASQTGYAVELATRTADSLRKAGVETTLEPLGRI